MRVADVALDPRSVGADALYTYKYEPGLEIGSAVFAPLGARSAIGFVTAVREVSEQELGFPFSKLRPVSGVIEGLSIPTHIVSVARFVAAEYLCSLPVALGPAIPPGVKDRLLTTWTLTGAPSNDLTTLQQEVVRTMQDVGGVLSEGKGKSLPAQSSRVLRLLVAKGIVTRSTKVALGPEKRRSDALKLTGNSALIESFLHGEGKKKPAQALTIMRLQTADEARLTAAEIKALAGVTDSTVRALVDSKLLEIVHADAARSGVPPEPNQWQQLAIEAIHRAIAERRHDGFLLFGVTGSGKTEVFLRAAAEALRQGRQVLYLVPEIALATQAISQLRARFGAVVAILHSELPSAERLRNWMQIRSGGAGVVLGARSAVFAPLDNLGLIIIDEEHEAAYKQENAPRYQARTVARELARLHGCPVVLGSATPSIESFYEAEETEEGRGRLTLLSLPVRAASAQLPEVDIEDLKVGYRVGQPALLTPELERRIHETIGREEQIILFLNRRAYSPFLMCRDCGHRMQCPNCAVSLSFHRKEHRLRCHHCGFTTRPPTTCPNCGRERISPFGAGTEKVEEIVQAMFPHARVARLDRDVARKKGALESTLASFRSGDIDILVGTQLVAKGLDFPNVTLVGVIAADVSLNIPDFRSSERTYQLLSQVAGRSGRGQAPGTVIIQTFNPENAAISASRTHEYLSFYEALREERRDARYPPFTKLINVTFSGESYGRVKAASESVAALLRASEFEVLGPVDCALERVQGRWRRHLLVKCESVSPVGKLLSEAAFDGVQMVVDVDPYSLM
jgi:primosomal protein N' (replication factor Y)